MASPLLGGCWEEGGVVALRWDSVSMKMGYMDQFYRKAGIGVE